MFDTRLLRLILVSILLTPSDFHVTAAPLTSSHSLILEQGLASKPLLSFLSSPAGPQSPRYSWLRLLDPRRWTRTEPLLVPSEGPFQKVRWPSFLFSEQVDNERESLAEFGGPPTPEREADWRAAWINDLGERIAKVLGLSQAEVEAELQRLTSFQLQNAWVRRTNLDSPCYQELFRQWWVSPRQALQELERGVLSQHDLPSTGSLYLSRDIADFPAELIREVLPGLWDREAGRYQRRGYASSHLEWAYFPQGWLPVLLSGGTKDDASIKTIFSSKGKTILWMGSTLQEQRSKKIAAQSPRFLVVGRLAKRGVLSASSLLLPSGERRNINIDTGRPWAQYSYWMDRSSMDRIMILGEEEPLYPQLLVRKNREGKVIRTFGIQMYFSFLERLIKKFGSLWLLRCHIGSPRGASWLLDFGSREVPQPDPDHPSVRVHFHYYVQRWPGHEFVDALIGLSSVPVYLLYEDKASEFLKVVQVRKWALLGEKTIEAVDSAHDNVPAHLITIASKRAQMLGGYTVITRLLPYTTAGDVAYVNVGNNVIWVAKGLLTQIKESWDSAEVLFDPETFEPARLRLGKYSSNDPLAYPHIDFQTVAEFELQRSKHGYSASGFSTKPYRPKKHSTTAEQKRGLTKSS